MGIATGMSCSQCKERVRNNISLFIVEGEITECDSRASLEAETPTWAKVV